MLNFVTKRIFFFVVTTLSVYSAVKILVVGKVSIILQYNFISDDYTLLLNFDLLLFLHYVFVTFLLLRVCRSTDVCFIVSSLVKYNKKKAAKVDDIIIKCIHRYKSIAC